MPKGPSLTSAEREEILSLRASNLSARDIAKKIDRSKTVVLNFLKSPATYGTVKRSGRKRALSRAQEQQIYKALRTGVVPAQTNASSGGGGADGAAEGGAEGRTTPQAASKLSAERIKNEFGLSLSTRRIQQLLSEWRRMTRKELDQQHALSGEVAEEEEESGELKEGEDEEEQPARVSVETAAEEEEESGIASSIDMEGFSSTPLVLDEVLEPSEPTEEAVV